MDGSTVVGVGSWRVRRDGERDGHRLDHVRLDVLADRMCGLWQARKEAIARVGDELVGEVCPHPDDGRLVWWCDLPEDDG